MPRSEPQIPAQPIRPDPSIPHGSRELVYSPVARMFHWTVAALVLITAPIGFIMADRGRADIWDATTNTLYSTHKLIGLIILTLMIARWIYRLTHGAPPSYAGLTPAQKGMSHAVHWSLYVLLVAVPIGGWLGISYYPALDIFGFKVPGLVTPNEETAKQVLAAHGIGACVLLTLVGLHLAGAAYHALIKSDGVLGRMWLRAGRES
jgi:cytochrome b561